MRLLKALAGALAAGALLAPSAHASWIDATPQIDGAGTIAPAPGYKTIPTCAQPLPALNSAHRTCDTWSLGAAGGAPTVVLYAKPEPGSAFDKWTGCDTVSGDACVMSVTAGDVHVPYSPKARFVDNVGPKITNFHVTPLEQ